MKAMMGIALMAFALAAPLFAADAVKKENAPARPALDGKSFNVMERTPEGKIVEDIFVFKDGKVESAQAKSLGYKPGRYLTKGDASVTIVAATFKHDSGGTRKLNASIAGGKMTGTIRATENGKTSKLTFAPKRDDKHPNVIEPNVPETSAPSRPNDWRSARFARAY